jgi:cytochrome c oxidase subunit 2
MAITPPAERVWWNLPVARSEIIWVIVAFIWGLVMFSAMVYWHLEGEQNLSNEAYRTTPEAFMEKATAMVDQYQVGEEAGMPVVHPPPGSEVYLVARLWQWWPIIEVCNEFCGIGHHTMIGKVLVTE